jgi:hypothetical protein
VNVPPAELRTAAGHPWREKDVPAGTVPTMHRTPHMLTAASIVNRRPVFPVNNPSAAEASRRSLPDEHADPASDEDQYGRAETITPHPLPELLFY